MKEFVPISKRRVFLHRLYVFGLSVVSTLFATLKWITVIPSDSYLYTKLLMVLLFALTFGWIALFFWSSLFGFWGVLRPTKPIGLKWADDEVSLTGKTALLMPVYNEEPVKVFADLLAMAQELEETGQANHFDIFVLSDTTNPKYWVKEEKLWLETQLRMPENIHLYYRRRVKNTARKSGNIEDFCNKWGSLYDFMIVLDADSLLSGKTLLKMSQLMEKNPDTGIIQAPPLCINRHSLFARIQQFAGKVYGGVIAAGSAYWQDGESNYWGHNAIIRVKAFMECCKLPVLTGKAPFGGHILSHDFVEASLICRGGWRTWLLPELSGSYEECPPSMIDFAVRDRRWCQGNLQHIKVLLSKGLNPISRIHFLIGIMSYVSSPIWLCFMLVGIAAALGRAFIPPDYFPVGYSLFPTWPIFDKFGTIALFLLSMFMLFFPKFLGLAVYILQNRSKDIDGVFSAIKSVFAEIIFSILSAPVMMMFQSKFVFDILLGRAVGWNTQNRDETGTPWKFAVKIHFWHTVLGILAAVVVWKYVNVLFWWTLPVTLGLALSIPLSVLSSRESVGMWAKKHKYFVIPEEINVPSILEKAQKNLKELEPYAVFERGVIDVICDSDLNALHLLMLPVNGPAEPAEEKTLKQGRIKLENFINYGELPDFSKEEETALLYSPDFLEASRLSYLLSLRNG